LRKSTDAFISSTLFIPSPVASKVDSEVILATRENLDTYNEMMKNAVHRHPAQTASPQQVKP